MKNKLTKIYNIFKQIENMSGSVGWDQIDVFYYFYEEHQNYLACWQLLYGLFSENKTLKPTIFGITLTELRKFSDAKSVIYTFENSEEPVLVATFERNGRHQISGTVKVEDTLITDEKEVTFVDGMNVDSDEDIQYIEETKSPELISAEISYLRTPSGTSNEILSYKKCQSLGGDINWLKQLKLILLKKNVDYDFFETYLINIDKLTSKEIRNLGYVEDRIDTHLEDFEDDTQVDNSVNKQISLTFSFFDYIEKFYALSDNELKSIINKLKNIEGFTMYIDMDNKVQWSSEEQLSEEIADKLNELLHSNSNTEKIIKFNLIEKSPNAYSGIFNPDTMVTEFVDISDDDAILLVSNYVVVCYHDDNDNIVEINDQEDLQEYRSNYNDNRLFVWKSELKQKGLSENFKNEVSFKFCETFQINGETPEGLYSIDDVRLFLDYLYDECGLLGFLHLDDGFDNYMNNNNSELFTKEQQELYNKYLDDIFELDADGESVFVAEGFDDAYDYAMNYRNDNYDNIKELENNSKLNNFDIIAYVEDGILSIGIRTKELPKKYPSSLFFIKDGDEFVTYIYLNPGENTSSEIDNFGISVEWDIEKELWAITGKNGFFDLVELEEKNEY